MRIHSKFIRGDGFKAGIAVAGALLGLIGRSLDKFGTYTLPSSQVHLPGSDFYSVEMLIYVDPIVGFGILIANYFVLISDHLGGLNNGNHDQGQKSGQKGSQSR